MMQLDSGRKDRRNGSVRAVRHKHQLVNHDGVWKFGQKVHNPEEAVALLKTPPSAGGHWVIQMVNGARRSVTEECQDDLRPTPS